MEGFVEIMHKPFPERLTILHLSAVGVPAAGAVRIFPNSPFSGSTFDSRLRELWLENCHFPALHKLLSSATGLVTLHLWNIPHSEYISPQAMVVSLSVMTRLETLHLKFRSPHSRPDPESRLSPPQARLVLQTLTELVFQGVHEYLEDFVAQIDTPQLYTLRIVIFMGITFDVPHLHRFVNRAKNLEKLVRLMVFIFNRKTEFALFLRSLLQQTAYVGNPVYRVGLAAFMSSPDL